jgi:hypothetical protein
MASLRVMIGVVVCGLVAIGCSKKSDSGSSAAPPPSASVVATPPSTAPAASVAPSGKMAHCPSTVEGAKTLIKDVEGGVEVTVTGAGNDAVSEIRARSKFLADAAKTTTKTVKHTGRGEGGGVFGRCPVVMRNTTVDIGDVESGTKILVKPESTEELDWLRRETRERNDELGAKGSEGAGVGKMAHCPNAVEGATSVIKARKDGIDVIVTAKDDAQVKEIRDRAKHLVEAAAKEAVDVKHTGEGTGGGGLGRCPVIMDDTIVTATDVPGGSDLFVKPKNAGDLDKVKNEAEDRVAKFAPGK